MSFSIRDYTNKMRTVNAFQCWLFDLGQLSQEDIQSNLPPMTTKDGGRRQVETDNSLGEASQNDKIALTREKSLRRRKSRLYTFTEIIVRKNDAENPPQTQVVVPLPPLPPPSSAPTFPAMVPPKPQPSNTQTKDLMNVIILDDEEEEDSPLITQFRRRPEGSRSDQYPPNEILTVSEINVAPPKGDAAKLKLQNPEINGSKKLKDTPENKMVNLGDSDASAQEKNWCSKNLSEEKKVKEKNCDSTGKQQKAMSPIHISENTSSGLKLKTESEEIHRHHQGPSSNVLASSFEKDKFSGSDEGTENLKRKELCLNLQMKQYSNGSAVQNFLKSCANHEKSMPSVKKSRSLSKVSFCDDNLVRFDKGDTPKLHFSSNAESFQSVAVNQNANFNGLSLDSNGNLIKFTSIGKVEMNQLEKSSKLRGSFSGLPVNNSLHHSRQENLSIGERNFAPNTLQDSGIQQNKEDKIPPKESSSIISACSSQPRMSLKGRDVQIGRSIKEKQKRGDFRFFEESRRHYSEGAAKHKSYTGSKLQISTENLYQPVKLESSSKTFPNNILMQSNSMFQNRSLGGVSRNVSSNISDQFRARTIPQGLVSNPALNNGETNDRKMHHNVTSSAFELSHLPPQPPLSWCLPTTHETLPQLISRNANLCPPAPIVQPAHVPVTNQPPPITRNTVKPTTKDNHTFSISRKRSADFIDLTKPNKLPNLEQENSSRVTKTNKELNSEKDDKNLS